MVILQYQFTNLADDEIDLLREFGNWLGSQIYTLIDNKVNRKKIQLRLKYLSTVNWIQWSDKYKFIDVGQIMNTLQHSFTVKEGKYRTFKLLTDINVLIPNTITPMDRLIRFLNYGDSNAKATGMFTQAQHYFSESKLNALWRIFVMNKTGNMSDARILLK